MNTILKLTFLTAICLSIYAGYIFVQSIREADKLIEYSHLNEMNQILENFQIQKHKQELKKEPKKECKEDLPIPTNPQEFPSQERLNNIYDIIYCVAEEQGFLEYPNSFLLYELADCESSFRNLVVGDITSRGLYQINKNAHPEVSDQKSFSVIESTKWAIEVIRNGQQYKEWVRCMRKIEDEYI